jgi:hypothetical protein
MIRVTVTKSIRLDPQEVRQIEQILHLMPSASESSSLKHLLLLGLDVQRKDLVVLLYTRDGLTTGEIAERLHMSRLEVLHTLQARHVIVFDPPLAAFEAALRASDLPGAVPAERPGPHRAG